MTCTGISGKPCLECVPSQIICLMEYYAWPMQPSDLTCSLLLIVPDKLLSLTLNLPQLLLVVVTQRYYERLPFQSLPGNVRLVVLLQ